MDDIPVGTIGAGIHIHYVQLDLYTISSPSTLAMASDASCQPPLAEVLSLLVTGLQLHLIPVQVQHFLHLPFV